MNEKIKLYHGDCLEVMKNIPNKSIDMVLTDVPYNEVNRKSGGLRKLDKGIADSAVFNLQLLVEELTRITKGSIYIFCGTEQVSSFRAEMVKAGMSTRLCIWEKTNPSPMNGKKIWLSGIECCVFGRFPNSIFNYSCKNTVWRFPTARGKLHPTMKPLPLMEYIIRASSREGEIVLDSFMGSGSTGVACVNTNRRFIGIEKDETYFKIAEKRIAETVK